MESIKFRGVNNCIKGAQVVAAMRNPSLNGYAILGFVLTLRASASGIPDLLYVYSSPYAEGILIS